MQRAVTTVFAFGLLVLSACSRTEPAQPAPSASTDAPGAAAAGDGLPPEGGTLVGDQGRHVPAHDPEVVNFEGFGPAKFGGDEESVRMSWGHPLVAGTPAEGATCYQLSMDPPPDDGRGIRFMFEDGRFARYDVDVARLLAPGDLGVGSTADEVLAKFAGRVEVQVHKYVPGRQVLVVWPEGGGEARLVFETNGEGIVESWRMGVPPQVFYVEGCG